MKISIKLFLISLLFIPAVLMSNAEINEDISAISHNEHHKGEFDLTNTIFHHIENHNVFSIGDWSLPLPVFVYAKDKGWSAFMSSKFGIGHHGDGHRVVDSYVLSEGSVFRIKDRGFPQPGIFEVQRLLKKKELIDDKPIEVKYAIVDGVEYELERRSTWDGGMLGGGMTSFYDFSMSKNVVFMLIMAILLFLLFYKIAQQYKRREGMAPTGVQNFFEPIIIFIRDNVAKQFMPHKYDIYLPYLLTIFFFILFLNFFGLIPLIGSPNATGNLSVTMALAFIAFLVVNLSGRKSYWQHVLWMPGIPWPIKALILTPIEFVGLLIKPVTLMIRLFANITSGHIVVIVLIGLIFIFGDAGESVGGSIAGIGIAVPLVIFMTPLKILVSFIQAFVFTMLVASYLGAAVEEEH